MADYKVVDTEKLESDLTGMADEVRTLADTDSKMSLEVMKGNIAEANEKVDSQSEIISQIKSALQGKVVSGGGKEEQVKTVEITENGSYFIEPDEGYTLSGVDVNVSVTSEFISVKLSNFDGSRALPKTADARAFDLFLPESRKTANEVALYYTFYNSNTNANGGLFALLEEVYLPSKALKLVNTFQNCTKLKYIYGDFTNIEGLNAAFDNCWALEDIPYMPNLTTIGNRSFNECRALTRYVVPPKVTSIHTSAFANTPNLLDLYVPFAEGAISGAPWGATNATIHYNTQYDSEGNPITT
ncbi:MAG: leucine-rich repeat domain-containing protein [Bacteroidales bacterium]|nr:leucine-rich repeat domain-containing protein [Bacteroidales bacterium]